MRRTAPHFLNKPHQGLYLCWPRSMLFRLTTTSARFSKLVHGPKIASRVLTRGAWLIPKANQEALIC
jgi:hypothetical protein